MKGTKGAAVIFLVLLFYAGSPRLSAAEVSITPSIAVREEYNDNIFLTGYQEESDFLTTVNPAVTLTYVTDREDLALDYRLYFDSYADNSDLNDVRQIGSLDSTTSLYRDVFFLAVSDLYTRVPIDERRQVAFDNLLANTTDTNRLTVNPYIEYPLSGTLVARAGYTYENLWYEEEAGDSAENSSADLSLTKELSPRLSASLSYYFTARRPERTEAYDRQDAGAGIDYSISPKLSLRAGAGQTWFDYKSGLQLDSVVWNVDAEYTLVKSLVVSAGYSEGYSDSVNVGAYKRKAATGMIRYSGKNTVSLSVFRNTDRYLTVDREDRFEGITLDTSVPVTARITGVLRGRYVNYEFLPEEEVVDRYNIGLSFNYAVRAVTATLGYTHNLSDSNVDVNDYRNNIAWFQVRLTI